jgi:hypothetical protein
VISYKQRLLFDENKVINYRIRNNKPKPTTSLLLSYNGILTISYPNDSFNTNNNNKFEVETINNNKISNKYIELRKINDLQINEIPIEVYLIDLTDNENNYLINEYQVK